MTLTELKSALDAYAHECEQVGRSPFMGTYTRDIRRASIDAMIAGIESSLVVIRTLSGDDGTDSIDACHAIQKAAIAMIGDDFDSNEPETNEPENNDRETSDRENNE